jgi:hypothetical protein
MVSKAQQHQRDIERTLKEMLKGGVISMSYNAAGQRVYYSNISEDERTLVLKTIRDAGPSGATAEDVVEKTDLPPLKVAAIIWELSGGIDVTEEESVGDGPDEESVSEESACDDC